MNITSSQAKVSLNVRNVFLNQSTPEIMTKVHVLSGVSVKIVTFEFIVRALSIFFTKLLTHSGRVVNLFDYVHAYTRGHHVTLETGKKARVSDFDRVKLTSFCQGRKRCCYASRVVLWQQRALESV